MTDDLGSVEPVTHEIVKAAARITLPNDGPQTNIVERRKGWGNVGRENPKELAEIAAGGQPPDGNERPGVVGSNVGGKYDIPNYKLWREYKHWSILEAACLICDYDPERTSSGTMPSRVSKTADLLYKSILGGGVPVAVNDDTESRVAVSDVFAWAKRHDLEVPLELTGQTEPADHGDESLRAFIAKLDKKQVREALGTLLVRYHLDLTPQDEKDGMTSKDVEKSRSGQALVALIGPVSITSWKKYLADARGGSGKVGRKKSL